MSVCLSLTPHGSGGGRDEDVGAKEEEPLRPGRRWGDDEEEKEEEEDERIKRRKEGGMSGVLLRCQDRAHMTTHCLHLPLFPHILHHDLTHLISLTGRSPS